MSAGALDRSDDPVHQGYLDVMAASLYGEAAGQAIAAAAASSVPPPLARPIDQKPFATAQARLAISGYQLEKMADGSFVVCRWGMVRALRNPTAVDEFILQVGA